MDETPQERFLKELSDKVLQQEVNGSKEEKDWFIRLRFHPSNYEIDNENKEKNDLLKLMDAKLNYKPTNIQRTQSQVIDAFIYQYHAEMVEDQVDIESLKNPKRGERGIWKKVYHWLWNDKFPRWQFNQFWQQFKQQETSQPNWIKFVPTERGMYWEEPVNSTPTIPCNQPLKMELNLNYPDCYLLLLNRELNTNTRFLVCPSLAFAPDNKIDQPPILLPQMGSIATQKNRFIEFKGEGVEEYLGIVSEKPIEIERLTCNHKQQFPILEDDSLNQLWQQLQQQQNWQVFYQSFQVVKPQP
ncbi:hypothetical protein [Planktothrix paucivesiculata]|uniref:DUF4384 domain-containing protein n=1 Tax=Planktothrix paucivesiculata PCC 9631 TaxID=671071 RepID=A0A7Z9BIM0_9CYAN|nr:hypothetical protein [Planktothrix paucivesiculata]VXD10730.1 conserved hypothetical protein [Planktothrix paucivesiculata PCC 9631]